LPTIYVSKHSRDHADSEYISHMEVDHKEANLSVKNKQINSLTHS